MWLIVLITEPWDKLNKDDDERDHVDFDKLHTSRKALEDVIEFHGLKVTIGPYVR